MDRVLTKHVVVHICLESAVLTFILYISSLIFFPFEFEFNFVFFVHDNISGCSDLLGEMKV